MFNEHDCFVLTKAIPNESEVKVGMIGVILMVFGGDPCDYEVEFPDDNGYNIGSQITFTLSEDYMSPYVPCPCRED